MNEVFEKLFVREMASNHLGSLERGQISCRELMRGEVLLTPIAQDAPILIEAIESPYSSIPSLRAMIYSRGIAAAPTAAQAKAAGGETE